MVSLVFSAPLEKDDATHNEKIDRNLWFRKNLFL
jgi:hypothetical protein